MKPTPLTFTPFAISILVILAIETVAGLSVTWFAIDSLVKLGIVRSLEVVSLLWILRTRISPPNDLPESKMAEWMILLQNSKPAIGICLAMLIFAVLQNRLDFRLPLFSAVLTATSNPFAFDLFIVSCILSPLAEELFFRGTIFRFFRQFGFLPALVISSLLFSTFHTTAWSFPLIPLLGGVICAASYEWGRSLVSPILIHATGNALLLFVFSP